MHIPIFKFHIPIYKFNKSKKKQKNDTPPHEDDRKNLKKLLTVRPIITSFHI